MSPLHLGLLVALTSAVTTPLPQWEGLATAYGCPGGGERFWNAPLYCDDGGGRLAYKPGIGPWVALDVSEYESGRVHCGDLLLVCTGRSCLMAPAWDAGHLYYDRSTGENWAIAGQNRIIVDVPCGLTWDLGWTGLDEVTIMNLSRMEGRATDE